MDATSFADMFRYSMKYIKFWKFLQKYNVKSNDDGLNQVLSG